MAVPRLGTDVELTCYHRSLWMQIGLDLLLISASTLGRWQQHSLLELLSWKGHAAIKLGAVGHF